MKRSQIDLLLKEGKFPVGCQHPELIETHISWVLLCEHIVFKIKKPVRYSFLDFSTLEQRLYYCQQEVVLNRRLVKDIYLGIVPVVKTGGDIKIVLKEEGELIDYAVMMERMDTRKRMDVLLQCNEVTLDNIEVLAEMLVNFHKKTEVIYGVDQMNVQHNFNDLFEEKEYLSKILGSDYADLIETAIHKSESFINKNQKTFKIRADNGMVRDCHGDLHSRNIFILEEPIIFDCIEFNPAIRQVDILNELAFFCMDLEAFGRYDLSQYFMVCYSKLSSIIHSDQDHDLFIYFKAYRANVRAKVNALRSKTAKGKELDKTLSEVKKYLKLMLDYLKQLDMN